MCSYCAPVWDGLGHTLSDRLQKLQNRAARVITHSSYDISSNLLLDQLKWNNLSVNRQKQKAILMYKTLNGQTPQYLHEMFTSRRCQYPLRNSNGKLFIPKPNTDYLKRSFPYSGAISLSHAMRPDLIRHFWVANRAGPENDNKLKERVLKINTESFGNFFGCHKHVSTISLGYYRETYSSCTQKKFERIFLKSEKKIAGSRVM